jgi:threonine synthase
MRYVSTRSKSGADNNDSSVSFEEALTSGYANDGGLFVPEHLPSISKETMQEWIYGKHDDSGSNNKIESYSQLMYTILRMFIDCAEVSDEKLQQICQESVIGFDDPTHCIPVVPFYDRNIDNNNNNNNNNESNTTEESSTSASTVNHLQKPSFYVAELFHGPTFCFKDLGMRTVIYLLYHFAQKRRRAVTLLVSTTGDTGPAAAQTIHDINDPIMNIIVHYPHEQISSFQQQQLLATTLGCDHIEIVAFHGGGDDMDLPIKRLLAASKMSGRRQAADDNDVLLLEQEPPSSLWTGVNSYNIVSSNHAKMLISRCYFVGA